MAKTIFQKITQDLDDLANLYNKTKNIKYKVAWYKLLDKLKHL